MVGKGIETLWSAGLERLKDPELVAGFQRYFGVREVKRNTATSDQQQPFISHNYDDLKRSRKSAAATAVGEDKGTSTSSSEYETDANSTNRSELFGSFCT